MCSRRQEKTAGGHDQLCEVCSEQPATIMFQPCQHVVSCHECCIRMKKCIECKMPITAKIDESKFFVSGFVFSLSVALHDRYSCKTKTNLYSFDVIIPHFKLSKGHFRVTFNYGTIYRTVCPISSIGNSEAAGSFLQARRYFSVTIDLMVICLSPLIKKLLVVGHLEKLVVNGHYPGRLVRWIDCQDMTNQTNKQTK